MHSASAYICHREKAGKMDFITIIDYLGTFAFAISGIRLAAAKNFDWFGAYVVGFVTAVGGGTLRDVMLDVTPFWMEQPSYVVITALALVFVVIFRRQKPEKEGAAVHVHA